MASPDDEWEAPFFSPPRAQLPPDVPAVLAFAAALQTQLGTIVTACLFAPGGGGRDAAFPCALVTVEPFSPGGLRRLALNARSELVLQVAAAYEKGVKQASRDRPTAAAFGRRQTAAALELGAAMLHSGSWPGNGLDLAPIIAWENALGLISGISKAFAWPVPHDTANVRRRSDPNLAALEVVAVWPKRVVRIKAKPGRGDSSEIEQLTLTAGARWMKREELLRLEWAALRCEAARIGGAGNGAASRFRLLTQRLPSAATPHAPRAASSQHTGPAAAILRSMLRTGGVATHSPELPLLALADDFSTLVG